MDDRPEASGLEPIDRTPSAAQGSPETGGDEGGQDRVEDDRVEDVGELLRVATMLQVLLDEVRQIDLDPTARERLAGIQRQAVDAIEQNLSPGLREELGGFTWPFAEGETPSEPELRIVQAQLTGWVAGLLQGLQAAAMSRQLAQRAASGQRPALPGEQPPQPRRTGAYL